MDPHYLTMGYIEFIAIKLENKFTLLEDKYICEGNIILIKKIFFLNIWKVILQALNMLKDGSILRLDIFTGILILEMRISMFCFNHSSKTILCFRLFSISLLNLWVWRSMKNIITNLNLLISSKVTTQELQPTFITFVEDN